MRTFKFSVHARYFGQQVYVRIGSVTRKCPACGADVQAKRWWSRRRVKVNCYLQNVVPFYRRMRRA